MTETAGAGTGTGGVARLDELAAVTREYAKYANERTGLAGVVVGAWLVATFAIALRSQSWGRAAALWAPPVCLVALVIGRRRYQARGVIIPSADGGRRAGISPWLVAIWTAAITASALGSHFWTTGPGDVAASVVKLAVIMGPLIPLLSDRIVRGGLHYGIVLAAMADAFFVASSGSNGEVVGWMMALVLLGGVALLGLLVAGAGIVEHRQFARLDRRLAALRSPAP